MNKTDAKFYICVFAVGIGVFADQVDNAALVEDLGYGLRLFKNQLEDSEAIQDVIEKVAHRNSSYARQASRFSEMWKSQMRISARDEATFWIESLLKYGNLDHLRLQDYHLNLIQYFSIDVIFMILTLLMIVSFCICKLCKLCCFKSKFKTD